MSTCENKGLIWLKYFLPLMLTGKMKDNVILTSSKKAFSVSNTELVDLCFKSMGC